MKLSDMKLDSVKDPVEKRLAFLAWLTQRVKEAGASSSPVLVGGGAVEFYTAGNYATKDIDIVFGNIDMLNSILLPEGFIREGRYWYNEGFDILVECPGSDYPAKITEVDVNGIKVMITAIEEITVDRLCAAKFWQSAKDLEWAKVMLKSGLPINLDYLRQRAGDEDVSDTLDTAFSADRDIQ